MQAINHSLVVLVAALVMTSGSDTTTEPSPGSSEPATPDVGRIMFQRAPGGEVVGEVETDVYVVDADGSESDVELLFADGGRDGGLPTAARSRSCAVTTGWLPIS